MLASTALPASALSELKSVPGQAAPASPVTPPAAGTHPTSVPSKPTAPVQGLPRPDPLIGKQPATEAGEDDSDDSQPVEVIYDISKVPEPVRRMRELIVEAAASGDIERLRALMNPGPDATQVAIGDSPDDPVIALKAQSGDPEGIEILAILLDVLQTGFVHTDIGTPEEAYVWPYFAEKSIAALTPPEKVELLRIVTAGDFADMLEVGNYNFYRVGITPDGRWKFFTAGD